MTTALRAPAAAAAVHQMRLTRVFRDNAAAWLSGKRHIWNEGGAGASKTYSILQLLNLIMENAKRPLITSVVSESLPHLKRGCIRDWLKIMGPSFDGKRWNRTDFTYRFPNDSILEYFSADEPSKNRGARRHILFANEVNNLPYETWQELEMRTELCVIGDWNPTSEFWYHHEGWGARPTSAYIHSTYLDALDVLPPPFVANIESYKGRDPRTWSVYGLGVYMAHEGLVYPAFSQEDALPEGGRVFYGLDFGFSTDRTALCKCVLKGEDLHGRELLYQMGLTNQDIAVRMGELGIRKGYDEIWADSAEPKSIEEIHRYGFNIKGVGKGPDSVEYGHQRVRQYRHWWTKDSLNAIKEQRNFAYVRDKDGKPTSKTMHAFSHMMDARRYAVMGATGGGTPIEKALLGGKREDALVARMGW